MPQIINTNIASINAQRNLDRSQSANQTALQRLSSGLRINSAKDDAAGLAISTRFTVQTRGLTVAIRNAGDGVSLAQTAEGALGAMTENLLRIRDLALQSANATNSSVDREALNEEVQQLKAEIKRVSEQTNFNGTKLLDGTFQAVTFQIGANEGEQVTFGIAPATTDKLGTSSTDGISSEPSAVGLSAGDLVINGIAVPASTGLDDNFSSFGGDASAIAKAAAINKVEDLTGVEAIINANSLGGSPFAGAVTTSGSVVINGVSINIATNSSLSDQSNLQNIANSINERTGESGVRAVFDGNLSRGIQLIAEDGRNIVIDATTGASTLRASSFGIASATTGGDSVVYAGTFTLISKDGSDIRLDTTSGDIDNAGLQVGRFSGNNSGSMGAVVNDQPFSVGDLVINGVPVGPTQDTFDTASSTAKDTSAIAKAAAINKVADKTGVTAVVNETLLTSSAGLAISTTAENGSFSINGVTISVAWSSSDTIAVRQRAVVSAVNNRSGQTGVRAEAFGNDSFRLLAEDGRNVDLNFTTTLTALDLGLAPTATTTNIIQRSSVTLLSAGPIDLDSISGNIENAGFEIGKYGSAGQGQLIQDVDISTVAGAERALAAVDNALAQINLQRAQLGAIQNRFESTISNQQIAAENLQAANSRIRDADFAAETAELSRSQVLQQAGLSILAQANGQPQQVLQLLQG